MNKRKTSKGKWYLVLGVVALSLALILFGVSSVLAQGPGDEGSGDRDDGPSAGEVGIASSAWDREVGVEYVSNYPWCCRNGVCGWSVCDLPCAANNAYGFYNTLRWAWWAPACTVGDCFIWGNSNAWEQDFKRTAGPGGGTNNNWVDNVDIIFYEGHGNPSLFTFERSSGAGIHDDSYLTYNDAYRAWGDKDAEWIALLSCSVLADSHEWDWYNTMDGLHLLLGFKTTAYDVCGFGSRFAQKIVAGYRIKDAWFTACDQKQPSGVKAKVLAEVYSHFNDTWYYQYPDYPNNGYYWWWWKSCGSSQPPLQVSPQEVAGVMPVFSTPALSLGERTSQWGSLTDAFQVPTQTVSLQQEGNYWVSISGTQELEMDIDNGLFYYIDHGKLYSMPTSSQVRIMSPQQAKDIADQFLTDNGLMPADAQFSEVTPVILGEVAATGWDTGQRSGPTEVLAETITDYQVIYSRVLTYTTTVLQGGNMVEQVHEFTVEGAGAKLKVYVDSEGGTPQVAAVQGGAVVGAQGGWRRITDTVTIQAEEPILSYDQIEQLFLELEPQVAFEHVPFQADDVTKEVLTYTLTYWEDSTGQGQPRLYPAFHLSATYKGTITTGPGVTETYAVTDVTWIPADETYMRPLAMIESHSDLSGTLWPGKVISFTAADAYQTLAALGYHESLTFTLGSGYPDSYFYDWYLNSVAEENRIGVGRNLEYTVTVASEAGHDVPVPQMVILRVVDQGSEYESQSTSTTSEPFNVVGTVFLPVVLKNY